jgi:hypothetical protein
MTELSMDSSVRVSEEVVFRELDGEAVLLHLGSGMYFGLDETGTRMWQLLVEHGRLSTVCELLCQEYDAAPATIERDLIALVRDLSAKGLLVSSQ